MKDIFNLFSIDSPAASFSVLGEGHINKTYLVTSESGKRYVFQQLSRAAFKNIDILMQNVAAVTDYLASKSDDPRSCLRLVRTLSGATYLTDSQGEYWRAYDYIENSLCLQQAETIEDFRQCAAAFGNFQRMLRDFPAESLHESIPKFHNAPDRYRIFKEVLAKDPCNRASGVQKEIEFILSREKETCILQTLRDSGALPDRVTHNDTKLNNVLLDADTRKALCVIDLDTVMPGLVAYDFGDAIRFGASTALEDERDLSKVHFSLELYNAFRDTFVESCGGLSEAELESLPLGARTITLVIGMRFLTDYLNGDTYFSISREGHNLDRARTQFKLVSEMEEKSSLMK